MNGRTWFGRRNVVQELPGFVGDRPAETVEEPSGAAGVDAAAEADREAAWEALRARVDATKAKPVTAAVVDMGSAIDAAVRRALADRDREQAEARRRAAEEAARREREEREAQARGGPCQYCGLTMSWERGDDGEPVGRWYNDGKTCTWCDSDRTEFAGYGAGRSDPEHRIEVLRRYIVPDTEWRGEYLLERCRGFRWWRDTPGAVGVETVAERFAHVDRAAIAAALEPPERKPSTRKPCPRCGCASLWFLRVGIQGYGSTQQAVESWVCDGCRGFGRLSDVIGWRIQMATWVLESLGAGMSQMLGAYWWSDDPRYPQPCQAPFDHIDWQAVRRNAFAVFPEERQWGNTSAWEHAREAAQT